MSAGLGNCDYCGRIAAVAINCGCGFRVAYCAEECRDLAALAIADHSADCDHAGRALAPSPVAEVLRDPRLAELLLGRARVEELRAPPDRRLRGFAIACTGKARVGWEGIADPVVKKLRVVLRERES